MNPDLELFLQEAFCNLDPGDSAVRRVAVEPDYEAGSTDVDPAKLRSELSQLLGEQRVDTAKLSSHEGIEISIPRNYPELSRSVRKIFLHGDKEDGPWVEVIPPGNWI